MADQSGADTRARMLDLLLERITEDRYPSETMLNMIEELAEPDDLPAYAAVLMEKISDDAYPSVSMMRRVIDVSG